MYSRIIFYGLSGLWWGTIFGCIHLLMIASETTGPNLLASIGVTGDAGALIGLIAGSMLKFVPHRLRVLHYFGVERALVSKPDKALQFRTRRYIMDDRHFLIWDP